MLEVIKGATTNIRRKRFSTMQIHVEWSREVSVRFPELAICLGLINGVSIQRENEPLRELKKRVYEEVRSKYSIETLKDEGTVRAYRDFYWKLNIDPTKTRPAGEALLRRVLHGDELPNVSTVVDAYNLASMKTTIPISGFDCGHLAPPLHVRFARDRELFTGIGMKTPTQLTSNILVLADETRVLCVYPYRDCEYTKITMETQNVAIVAYSSPGMTQKQLREAVQTALSFIKTVSGGEFAIEELSRSSFI